MQFRHIVAMRFLTTVDPKVDSFSKESIEFYANICRKYTVKSLTNQTNVNFDPVFLVRDNYDVSTFGPLVPVAADLGASIVRYGKFTEFCSRYAGRGNLIVTRCDADDLFNKHLVEEVQLEAGRVQAPFVYGYQSSLLYRIGTPIMRSFTVNYSKGHWSAFQSVVYGKDSRIAKVTPYCWKHPCCLSKLMDIGYSEDNARKMIVNGKTKFPYIWLRNSRNLSHDNAKTDTRYPVCSDISTKDVEDLFGVHLDF